MHNLKGIQTDRFRHAYYSSTSAQQAFVFLISENRRLVTFVTLSRVGHGDHKVTGQTRVSISMEGVQKEGKRQGRYKGMRYNNIYATLSGLVGNNSSYIRMQIKGQGCKWALVPVWVSVDLTGTPDSNQCVLMSVECTTSLGLDSNQQPAWQALN